MRNKQRETNGMIEIDHIDVTMSVALRQKVAEAADAAGIPMTMWMRQVAAQAIGDPALAKIRRARAGRPRKDEKMNGNGNGNGKKKSR